MEILSILAVFLAEFLIGFLGAKWAFSFATKMNMSDGEGFSFPLGVVVLLASFVCVSLVYGSHLGGANAFFFYAVIAMGLVVMVLTDMKLPMLPHILGMTGIGLISSYFLPFDLLVSGGFSGFLTHIGLALVWGVLTWLFVQMDRVPFMSMILSLSFAVFYFLLSNLLHHFEPAFGYLSVTLVVVLLGVNAYLKRMKRAGLGKITASFVGFVWGGMGIYVLASGSATAVTVLYSYALMEIGLSVMASIVFYQRFAPVYPFMIEQVISSKTHPEGALKFVMRWEILMACLAILAVLNNMLPVESFYIVIVLLSANIYMRLKSWGEPAVRLRDVWRDAKQSVQQIKVEIKTMVENTQKKKQMASAKKDNDDGCNMSVHQVKEHKKEKVKTPKRSSSTNVKVKTKSVNTRKTVKKSPKNKKGE